MIREGLPSLFSILQKNLVFSHRHQPGKDFRKKHAPHKALPQAAVDLSAILLIHPLRKDVFCKKVRFVMKNIDNSGFYRYTEPCILHIIAFFGGNPIHGKKMGSDHPQTLR